MLSKSATEQVINALKEVITDFNQNLTEQFGENFKALDAAVHRLVEWQENYRNQLEQMGEQYQQGVAAITQTELSVAHISEESKQIPQTMESLQAVLEVNQHQIEELSRHLQAFKEVRDQAVEAVPELQQQVEATVTGISDATQQLTTSINESATNISTELTNTSTDLTNNAREMMQILTDGAELMTQAMTNVAARAEENVNSQLELIDKSMEQEIERTMQAMGKALASISGQFTDDYKSLVSAMQDIVQRGNRQ